MEGHWLILGRVVRVVPTAVEAQNAAQAQVEHAAAGEAEDAAQEEQAAAGVDHAAEVAAQEEQAEVGEAEDAAQVQAQAEDAERAQLERRIGRVDAVAAEDDVGEPGFIISVAPPPRVTFVTARDNSHPDGERRDMYPYIIATGPFCVLAHFTASPNCGTDFSRDLKGRRHLIVVRHFRRTDDGKIVATAERVPARPRGFPVLRNIESVGLLCDGYSRRRSYNYRIAELMVITGRIRPSLELVCFTSESGGNWFTKKGLKSPLVDWDRYRRWVPHGAVALDSTVLWFDLSWGILSCDPKNHQRPDFGFNFYRLPRGRALRDGEATADIHTRRCITVSGNLVRYVEIIIVPNAGAPPVVSMWSLRFRLGIRRWEWIANYRVSFQEIWDDDSYVQTHLPHDVPVLAGVCPANPNVVYFDLQQRLFGVNVPERRVVDYEANQHGLVNVPGAPQPQTGSSRYLVTWNLVRQGRGVNIGHVSPDLQEEDLCDSDD